MRTVVGLLVVLSVVCETASVAAQAVSPESMVLAYQCVTGDATVALYTVPVGFQFLLTDIHLSSDLVSSCIGRPFELAESGAVRMSHYVSPRAYNGVSSPGVIDQDFGFGTPVVFHENTVVSIRLGGQCNPTYAGWCVSINGYLVAMSATGAVGPPVHGDGIGLEVFPNPGGSTRFALSTRINGHVTLEVFDVSGRRVAQLLDKSMPAGSKDVIWSGYDDAGRRLPSGVYFPRAQVGGAMATAKFVLVR